MFIDELIKFCKRKSENIKLKAEPQVFVEIAEKLEELKTYKDLEEQGLLLRLPCKVGDSLYQPIRNVINEYKVIGICYDIEKNKWLFEVAYQLGLEWYKTVCEFKAIGKTVFLTKEEAEQELERIKNKNEM